MRFARRVQGLVCFLAGKLTEPLRESKVLEWRCLKPLLKQGTDEQRRSIHQPLNAFRNTVLHEMLRKPLTQGR